ncbi:MAG: cytochrome b [Pseudomonadota bacterium]
MDKRLGYTGLQKLLHWLIAVLILAMLVSGFVFTNFDNKAWVDEAMGPGSFDFYFETHKSVGLIVLLLMALRLVTRAFAGKPPYYPPIASVERTLSEIVHWLLYALLIISPLLGWAAVTIFPALTPFFGLFDIPAMPGVPSGDRELYRSVADAHEISGLAIAILASLHALAAFYHGIFKSDGVFARMTWG